MRALISGVVSGGNFVCGWGSAQKYDIVGMDAWVANATYSLATIVVGDGSRDWVGGPMMQSIWVVLLEVHSSRADTTCQSMYAMGDSSCSIMTRSRSMWSSR